MNMRRIFLVVGGTSLALGLYAATVFPTQALIHERQARAEQAVELARIDQENSLLSRQISRLNNPTVIEEIARQDYGMYPKDSTPYQILPSSPLYHR